MKIYINGEPQATDVAADALKNSIRTTVPLKAGQRHSSERLDGVIVNALRIYGRALAAREVDQLAWPDRIAAIVRTPADKRARQRAGCGLRLVAPLDRSGREGAASQALGTRSGTGRHQVSGHASPM